MGVGLVVVVAGRIGRLGVVRCSWFGVAAGEPGFSVTAAVAAAAAVTHRGKAVSPGLVFRPPWRMLWSALKGFGAVWRTRGS